MKNVKFLLAAAFALFSLAATAQQDFSSPQYARYGDTPEEREKNILNLNFFRDSYDSRDYNAASHYLNELIKGCPGATQSIYQRGATIFKNKIGRAKSLDEKKMYVDSLYLMYDLRNQYFGDGGTESAKILDMKAREVLQFSSDRAEIRKAFVEAIALGGDNADPETVVAYFSNLCEDYKNTDQVMPEQVIAEYDRLSPYFDKNPAAAEFRSQFDATFGLSGVASCENLEKLFRAKLAASPEDPEVIGQAVSLMSRAKCESDFYFQTAEKYYQIKPMSETALFLAQAFQNKKDYVKATKYITEALSTEQDPTERQKLYVRMALIQIVSNDISGAAASARQARDLNPSDGVAYFLLAQCYAASGAACGGFVGQTAFWAAYDTMAKAVELLGNSPEYLSNAKSALAGYRSRFPSSEECFFNEVQEGAGFTVACGTAAGIRTTVRAR